MNYDSPVAMKNGVIATSCMTDDVTSIIIISVASSYGSVYRLAFCILTVISLATAMLIT